MGELATEGVSRIAEVATSVPKTVASVTSDKKLQECVLQTMCYMGTPFFSEDKVQRKRYVQKKPDIHNFYYLRKWSQI